MRAVFDDPGAVAQDVARGGCVAGEDGGGEPEIGAEMFRFGGGGDDADVCTVAWGEAAHGTRGGLGTAGTGGLPEDAGGVAGGAGEDVAAFGAQALGVFEQAQLGKGVQADVAVGADAEASAGFAVVGQGEQAVAEVAFGAGA